MSNFCQQLVRTKTIRIHNERKAMTTRACWALVVALGILLQPAYAEAQSSKAPVRGPWEIAAQAGGFDDDFEFDPDGSAYFIDPDQNVIFTGFLGYHLPTEILGGRFFLGAEGRYVPLDIRPLAAARERGIPVSARIRKDPALFHACLKGQPLEGAAAEEDIIGIIEALGL